MHEQRILERAHELAVVKSFAVVPHGRKRGREAYRPGIVDMVEEDRTQRRVRDEGQRPEPVWKGR